MERYSTYKRIGYAINYLLDEHYTYTYKQISELIGVSISTVKRNIKLKKEDFEREFKDFNREIKEVLNTDFNNFSTQYPSIGVPRG
jgi:transposase